MKVKIIAIYPGDSFYQNRKDYLGKVGEFVPSTCIMKGYMSGKLKLKGKEPLFFYAFKGEEIERKKLEEE